MAIEGRRFICALATVVTVAATAAACSSSGTPSGNGASSGSASSAGSGNAAATAAVAAAKRKIEPFLTAPQALGGFTTQLSAKPPPGKTIAFLNCNVQCVTFGTQLTSAAKVLGWTVKNYNFDNSNPESVIDSMNHAIDDHVGGIVLPGVSPAQVTQPLARAKAANIPVMINAAIFTPTGMTGNGVIGLTSGSNQVTAGGQLVADWAIADSGGQANVAIFTDNDFSSVKITAQAAQAEITKACPGCQARIVPQATTAIGTQTPSAVVSLVQQDPSINYVMFTFGALAGGVSAALKAAGLASKVKIIGVAPVEANLQGILDGSEAAWGGWSDGYMAWNCIDALARYFVKDSNKPNTDQVNPMELFDSGHRPPNTDPLFPVNYPALYSRIWNAS